jgi:3-hydroxyisobutyrate dehydrogenase-like beta-hydroxyacid dehydrogenase
MTEVTAGGFWQVDIAQLKLANATMRLANQALASENVAVLSALGFSLAHIRELRRKGGFRPSSIALNTRMISCLQRRTCPCSLTTRP